MLLGTSVMMAKEPARALLKRITILSQKCFEEGAGNHGATKEKAPLPTKTL